jgi:hypothetical protein
MRGLRSLAKSEEGATLVIVAVMLIAILGFTVIVVDVGGLLTLRREMVRSSDSAALAAAQSYASNNAAAASGQADSFAGANVDSPTRTLFSPQAGLPGFSCVSTACGSITVRYTKNQQLYFAPVLGLNSVEDVAHTSTAIWGPPGGGVPTVPLVASDTAIGDCNLPGAAPGDTCTMFYSAAGDGTTSASSFGWLNLSSSGWNVGPGTGGCSGPGASTVNGWLDTPVLDLTLNWPLATYVCPANGVVDSNWQTLHTMATAHAIVSFPVTDKDGSYSSAHGGTAPHGSIPTSSGGTAKYDAVGFVSLQLMALYDGSDPLVLGTPGTADIPAAGGHCDDKNNLNKNDLFSISVLNAAGCPGGIVPTTVTTSTPFVYDLQNNGSKNPYKQCPSSSDTNGCDYVWDPLTFRLLWVGNGKNGVGIEFDWSRPAIPGTPGTPGLCGAHYNAKNQDKCLITQTVGFTQTGGDPGGGADFGIRAIRLAQ